MEATKSNIDWLRNETQKMKDLFKPDHHGTVRPKVDMLSDLFTDSETNIWTALNELQKRIEKLEKK